MAEHKEYDNHFRPLPVAELLTEDFRFDIPSFQRGYRWERKQVTDLLEDRQSSMEAAARSTSSTSATEVSRQRMVSSSSLMTFGCVSADSSLLARQTD